MHSRFSDALRRGARGLLSHTPSFRGKGRITLAIDRVVTDASDPDSYNTTGVLLGRFPFHFDLRPWGQKFAFYYGEWERAFVVAFRRLFRGGLFVAVGRRLGLSLVCCRAL